MARGSDTQSDQSGISTTTPAPLAWHLHSLPPILHTPAKTAAFKKLPPHRISKTTFKGKPVWVYPDQNVCGCLYVGGQTAYNTFIKKGRAQMIDSRVNQMYNQDAGDPYNPTATMAGLDWGDAWDDADAYGLYVN